MTLKQKIEELCKQKGISKVRFCELLELNYVVLLRNLKANNITGDLIEALAEKMPDVDLNWIIKNNVLNQDEVNDPIQKYEVSTNVKIDRAIRLLEEVRKELTHN